MQKILIIEDNFNVADNLSEILELSGFETFIASNGKDGVAKAIKNIPDLILCDVMMPELDGFGVKKILSENEITQGIPLIFLTARADKQDFRKGMNLGAVDYITKPFDDSELLEAIKVRLKATNQNGTPKLINKLYQEDFVIEELKSLCNKQEIRRYDAKSYIYQQNKQPYYVYYILDGIVKISIQNEIDKSITTNLYTKDHVVGIAAILGEEKYYNSAICLTDTQICLIPKDKIWQLLQDDPRLKTFLLKSLSKSITIANNAISVQAYGSVRFKVAHAILTLDKAFGGKPFKVSREEIAELAGTAKETTIRMISSFRSENLITISDSKLSILDKKALLQIPI